MLKWTRKEKDPQPEGRVAEGGGVFFSTIILKNASSKSPSVP